MAAGDLRIGESDALARQEQRAVEVVLGQCLNADPLRVGRPRRSARDAALMHGDERAERGQGKQRRDAGEREAQAALRALGRGPPGVEERTFARVELALMTGAPLQGDGQSRPAIEVARIASALLPVVGGPSEVLLDATALGILFEPPAQAGPFAQQRLVGNLDRGGAHGQQPAVGEHLEDGGDLALGAHPRAQLARPACARALRRRLRRRGAA